MNCEKPTLKEIQQSELEILKYFRDFCNENGLKYFITAGTLLGAVRHRGFIPWDDDVDVVMPRDDYDRFVKLMRKNKDKRFIFQSAKTDRNYPIYCPKLREKKYIVSEVLFGKALKYNGCYIDILPLDKCPAEPRKARIFFDLNVFLTTALIKKINPEYPVGYTKKNIKKLHAIVRLLPRCVIRLLRELLRRSVKGDMLCTVDGAHGYPHEVYKREWFSEQVPIEFEGEIFSAPIGWDKLLKNMYGDYMELPNEDKRSGHFVTVEEAEENEKSNNLRNV